LVDAIVAWGDVAAINRRVAEHQDAGADYVALQVLDADPHGLPAKQWEGWLMPSVSRKNLYPTSRPASGRPTAALGRHPLPVVMVNCASLRAGSTSRRPFKGLPDNRSKWF
jgi:hypothetical protein